MLRRRGFDLRTLFRKIFYQQEFLKGFILVAMLFFCSSISWIMNRYDPGGNVYTHLFYIPVIISSIWFGRKTFILTLSLSVLHLFIEMERNGYLDYNPFVRVFALNGVAVFSVLLMKRIHLLYEKVMLQNESMKQMNESIGDVMGRCEVNGTIRYITPSVTRIFGYLQDEVIGMDLTYFVDDKSRIAIEKAIACAKDDMKEVYNECLVLSKYRGNIWTELSVNPIIINGSCIGIVFRCSDISDRKKAEEIMVDAINKDGLTGIYNRRFIDEAIEQCLAKEKKSNQTVSILMLDIDFFKRVNDKYGHSAGDAVLIKISNIMKGLVRSSDYVARFGGEEFMIILHNTDKISAFVLAERIRRAIEKYRFEIVGKVTISIGITYCTKKTTKEILYEKADKALYIAKERGRNQSAIYCEKSIDMCSEESLSWNKKWTSGNLEIDNQHKKLFDYLKEIVELKEDKYQGNSVGDILLKINGELLAHFSYEESILKTIKFPELQEHIEKHNRISQEIDKLGMLVKNQFTMDTVIIAQLLSDCIIEHLESEDMKYFTYLSNK